MFDFLFFMLVINFIFFGFLFIGFFFSFDLFFECDFECLFVFLDVNILGVDDFLDICLLDLLDVFLFFFSDEDEWEDDLELDFLDLDFLECLDIFFFFVDCLDDECLFEVDVCECVDFVGEYFDD